MVLCVEGACFNECCILCFNRNLVNGKNKIKDDLNDLPFIVSNLSEYICKKCLTLVKKRMGLKEKLKDIDCYLTALYQEKCRQINLSMKRKHSAEDDNIQPSEEYAFR